MELKIWKEPAVTHEIVLDSVVEQAIECDILLPDYCPDIARILKTDAKISVTSTNLAAEHLTIDGCVYVRVHYCSDGNEIRPCEYKMPFSKVCTLKAPADNAMILMNTSINYLNSRAVSPRRVDVRGAFGIKVQVIDQKNQEMIQSVEGCGVQLRCENTQAVQLVGRACHSMTVREELEIGYGKPAVGYIVRSNVAAEVTDYKIIANKVIAKGELAIDILYCGEEDSVPQSANFAIPVSQIADLDGVDEDCRCDVRVSVLSAEIKPSVDGDGNRMTLEAVVETKVQACRTYSLCCAEDAYSTYYECSHSTQSSSVLNLLDLCDIKQTVKEVEDLPPDLGEITDFWCEVQSWSHRLEGSAVIFSGKLLAAIFALDSEEKPAYYEKTIDFEIPYAFSGGAVQASQIFTDASVTVTGSTYSGVSPDQMEMRSELSISGGLYVLERRNALSEIVVDEEKPRKTDAAALTIYYADRGEMVWDIAKRYGASVTAVMEENALDSTVLRERSMLLIPMVK